MKEQPYLSMEKKFGIIYSHFRMDILNNYVEKVDGMMKSLILMYKYLIHLVQHKLKLEQQLIKVLLMNLGELEISIFTQDNVMKVVSIV